MKMQTCFSLSVVLIALGLGACGVSSQKGDAPLDSAAQHARIQTKDQAVSALLETDGKSPQEVVSVLSRYLSGDSAETSLKKTQDLDQAVKIDCTAAICQIERI